ncbi:MAG: hypothetical protein J6J24_01265 [Clostridia bacterium]|nr:hypothetical protein [Clostridia bacterium]
MLVVIFSSCFSGCGQVDMADILQPNAFRILRRISPDGSISLSYVFPLNGNLLVNNGFSKNEVDVLRFYLTTYVNALAKNNEDKKVEGVDINSGLYFEDVDGVGFSINFKNLEAQQKFFGSSSNKEEGGESTLKTTGFFIRKQTLKTVFPISSTKIAGDLKLVCVMAISSWCNDCQISEERKNVALSFLQEAKFIYDFSNWQRGLKSELMYQDTNGYHNVFVKSYQDLSENVGIVFWQIQPNRPIWYLSALAVVLIGIALAFLFLKKKKTKKS